MTPVLAMTVVREAAIAAFTPEKFYTVDLELTSGCTASSRRIPEKSVAENLLKACRKEMVATIQRITRKEKSENEIEAGVCAPARFHPKENCIFLALLCSYPFAAPAQDRSARHSGPRRRAQPNTIPDRSQEQSCWAVFLFGGDAYSVSAFQNHHRQAQPRAVRCCRGCLSERRTAVQ